MTQNSSLDACVSFSVLSRKKTQTISLTKLHILSFPDCESRAMAVSNPSLSFLCGSDGKESACNVGDLGSISGLGRSPGGGHGNSLQYTCLENPHEQRSLVGYSPWGCKESDMTEQLSMCTRARAHTHTHTHTHTHKQSLSFR